jgi:hypothetical protein
MVCGWKLVRDAVQQNGEEAKRERERERDREGEREREREREREIIDYSKESVVENF